MNKTNIIVSLQITAGIQFAYADPNPYGLCKPDFRYTPFVILRERKGGCECQTNLKN